MLAVSMTLGSSCSVPLVGGSSSLRVADTYLYTGAAGTTVFALHLVRSGSRLTGKARYLGTVTSHDAETAKYQGAEVLTQNGAAVPFNSANSTEVGTGGSDNGACGGTSACVERLEPTINGQLGNHDRVSVSFGPGDRVFGANTLVGTVGGNDMRFDTPLGHIEMTASNDTAVKAAYDEVFALLPKSIQTANLGVEAEYLDKKGQPNQLDEDASGLETLLSNVAENPSGLTNPYVCEFESQFSHGIAQTQEDIHTEASEVEKARRQLVPYRSPGSSLYMLGLASGYEARLTSAIASSVRRIDAATSKANAAITKANRDAPSIIKAVHGISCFVGKELEAGFHVLPLVLAAS